MLDLEKIGCTVEDADDGADVHLLMPDPTNPVPLFHDDEQTDRVTIRVLGHDGTKWRAITRKRNDRRAKRGKKELTEEEVEAENIEWAADITVGWNLAERGQKLEFTPSEARRIYKKYPWIRDQVLAGSVNRGNFRKASTKS